MNNQECIIRTNIIDNSNNELIFYPFSVSVNKCSESYNSINDPYAKLINKGGMKINADVNTKN